MSAPASPSAPAPLRLTLLEERTHALDYVIGGQRKRELRAQVVERVVEVHVQLTAHGVLAEAHDQRGGARELERPLAHRLLELRVRYDAVDDVGLECLLRTQPLTE